MRRLFLLKIICFLTILFFTAGCAHMFFIREAEDPMLLEMKAEIQALLDTVSYAPYANKRSVFDCSNQTAYLYDFFSQRGYQCEIVIGTNCPLFFLSIGEQHAWLIVKKNGKKIWVESNIKQVVSPKRYNKYFLRFSFHSLKKLQELSDVFHFYGEWEY